MAEDMIAAKLTKAQRQIMQSFTPETYAINFPRDRVEGLVIRRHKVLSPHGGRLWRESIRISSASTGCGFFLTAHLGDYPKTADEE